jgi:tRNA G18 (ribose-2'-O)-methylase SpoU
VVSPSAVVITDAADPRVADFQRLNDGSHRRRLEAPGPFDRGQFVAEGWRVLERLLRSRYEPRAILVVDDRVERVRELLGTRRVPTFTASRPIVDEIVGFPLHRGVVATADRGRAPFASTVIARSRQLVVLEGINDAENLGALLRSARVLGAEGVLVDETCADPLSRRAVRVSMGHALELPIARFSWHEDLATLRDRRFVLCAMTPREGAIDVADVEIDHEQPVAVVLGAEGPGLTDAALEAADLAVRIGVAEGVDSLNVAAAGAIACHRLFSPRRQR